MLKIVKALRCARSPLMVQTQVPLWSNVLWQPTSTHIVVFVLLQAQYQFCYKAYVAMVNELMSSHA